MLTRSRRKHNYSTTTITVVNTVNKKRRKVVERLSLPTDVFSLIMEFLDATSIMFLASTSKEIQETVTYELVIRNTVMHGMHRDCRSAFSGVLRLLDDLEQQTIYIPSPMRMLRLLNGKRCEGHGCDGKVDAFARGLLLCDKCRGEKFFSYDWGQRKKYAEIMNDSFLQYCGYLTKRPFRSIDRQRNGSVITKADVERMLREDIAIDEYLDDHCFETMDTALIQKLRQVLKQAMEDRDARLEEILNRKPDKILAVERAISQIQAKLQGPAKDFALDYKTYNSNGKWRVCMTYRLTASLMGMVLFNPDKYATEKRMREMPELIDAAYNDVAASGLVDFTCFSTNMDTHPLEAFLRNEIEQIVPPGDPILRRSILDKEMLRVIRAGNTKLALLQVAFSTFTMVESFWMFVVSKGTTIGNMYRSLEFARRMWHICSPNRGQWYRSWACLQEICDDTCLMYQRLSPLIHRYLTYPETRKFLSSGDFEYIEVDDQYIDEGTISSYLGSRKSAVILDMWQHQDFHVVKFFLLDEDWDALLEYHKKKVKEMMLY